MFKYILFLVSIVFSPIVAADDNAGHRVIAFAQDTIL